MPETPVVGRIANVTAFVGDTFEPRVVDLEIRDGRIASIDPTTGEPAGARAGSEPDAVTLDGSRMLAFPGMVDAHDHLRNLTPGITLSEGMTLDEWLRVWWAHGAEMGPEEYRVGALLGSVQRLKTGITTVVDHCYTFHAPGLDEASIQGYEASGARWIYARGIMTRPYEPVCETWDQAASRIRALVDSGLVPRERLFVAPVSIRQVLAEEFRTARDLAEDLGVGLYTHVAETASELDLWRRETGTTPIRALDDLGFLTERSVLVHCVHVDDGEIDLIARRGSHVVHCPTNHLKLAKGFAPVPDLLAAGVNVAMGVDMMADMLIEMRTEIGMHAAHRLDPAAVSRLDAFRMATRNGGRAVGWGDRIGLLEPGHLADIVLLDARSLLQAPLIDPAHALLYASDAGMVRHVLVEGRWVVRDGRSTLVDEDALLQEAEDVARAYMDRLGPGAGAVVHAMRVLVCGSGPGGMAVAAHMAAAGREVTIADLPEFPENLTAIAARGGVEVRSSWTGVEVVGVAVAEDVPRGVEAADLVVVSVPALAHERWVAEVAPSIRAGAALLFMGEGGGSLVARRVLAGSDRAHVLVGETNCLPLIGRAAGPGAVTGDRKSGGVLLAAVPAARTAELLELVRDVWPFVEAAGSVFETALVNYDAIDTVPVALANAGAIEGRGGGVLLWGEGATRSVVRLVEALDGELFALRRALGGRDPRRYREFLIAQGLAPDRGGPLRGDAGRGDRPQLPPQRFPRRSRGAAGPRLRLVAHAGVVDRARGGRGDARHRRSDRHRGSHARSRSPRGRSHAGLAGARRARRGGAPGGRRLTRRPARSARRQRLQLHEPLAVLDRDLVDAADVQFRREVHGQLLGPLRLGDGEVLAHDELLELDVRSVVAVQVVVARVEREAAHLLAADRRRGHEERELASVVVDLVEPDRERHEQPVLGPAVHGGVLALDRRLAGGPRLHPHALEPQFGTLPPHGMIGHLGMLPAREDPVVEPGEVREVHVVLHPACGRAVPVVRGDGGDVEVLAGGLDERGQRVVRLVEADPHQAVAFLAAEPGEPGPAGDRGAEPRRDPGAGAVGPVRPAVVRAPEFVALDRAQRERRAPVHAQILEAADRPREPDQDELLVEQRDGHGSIGDVGRVGHRVPEPPQRAVQLFLAAAIELVAERRCFEREVLVHVRCSSDAVGPRSRAKEVLRPAERLRCSSA